MPEVPVDCDKTFESREVNSTRASLVAVTLARMSSLLCENTPSAPLPHTSQSCPEVQLEAVVLCCPPLPKPYSLIAVTRLMSGDDFSRAGPLLLPSGTLASRSSFLPSSWHPTR